MSHFKRIFWLKCFYQRVIREFEFCIFLVFSKLVLRVLPYKFDFIVRFLFIFIKSGRKKLRSRSPEAKRNVQFDQIIIYNQIITFPFATQSY